MKRWALPAVPGCTRGQSAGDGLEAAAEPPGNPSIGMVSLGCVPPAPAADSMIPPANTSRTRLFPNSAMCKVPSEATASRLAQPRPDSWTAVAGVARPTRSRDQLEGPVRQPCHDLVERRFGDVELRPEAIGPGWRCATRVPLAPGMSELIEWNAATVPLARRPSGRRNPQRSRKLGTRARSPVASRRWTLPIRRGCQTEWTTG